MKNKLAYLLIILVTIGCHKDQALRSTLLGNRIAFRFFQEHPNRDKERSISY